jgi:hypothetical protein
VREREQTFCLTGKDISPGIAKQCLDLCHAFRGPVEEVNLDNRPACLLKLGNFAGSKGSGITIYRDYRMAGGTE